MRANTALTAALALLLLTACGGPPTKVISEAEGALADARLAEKCAPEEYAAAKRMVDKANRLSEQEKYDALLPLARDHKTKLIALAMDDSGMPKTADERLAVASKLLDQLIADGIDPGDIYLDPLVFPVSTDPQNGNHVLNTIRAIKEQYLEVNTIGGLSNVSYGLPERFLVNRAFTVLCLGAGLDGAIIDPLDTKLMSLVLASEAILGKDEFCMDYVTAHREEKLEL